jgi:hypothetical protein
MSEGGEDKYGPKPSRWVAPAPRCCQLQRWHLPARRRQHAVLPSVRTFRQGAQLVARRRRGVGVCQGGRLGGR